ncbi:hypothetical protein L596_013150 [Steinernema carpocapsae]|uniref:BTB domain-containing protein n=1 Tax=Steinernema carpocapsae TaxID=34508 RepID=A0A4V6A515_STECR|nr:hypothetical protein L596_013150 [Steinernema carpocapsae]
MTDKGTIVLSEVYNTLSNPVEIREFEWTAESEWNTCRFREVCDIISCNPKKKNNRTILWSCAAVGTLAVPSADRNQYSVYHFWNASFSNGCTDFYVHPEKSRFNKACKFGNKGEIRVNIVDSFYADLSEQTNPLIFNSADAVKLKIDGEEIWVSKMVLSHHSKFFDVFFNGDFKEKAEDSYELKDIKLEDFLYFLEIVHNLKTHFDESTVEGLLKLGNFFQCKVVLDRCEDFLENASVQLFPLLEKLHLADKFKLHKTLGDVVEKLSIQRLKNVGTHPELSDFTRELMLMKLSLNEP